MRFLLVFAAALSLPAHAAPSFSGSAFLDDDQDSNVVYAPYDAVILSPQLSLSYEETEGGLLGFTASAGYSEQRRAAIADLERAGKRVLPLTPTNGTWSLTVDSEGVDKFLGVQAASLPEMPMTTSLVLGRKSLKDLVKAYSTGAKLAVSYDYDFRATLSPMRLRASIHWRNLETFLQADRPATTPPVKSAAQVRQLVQLGIERGWIRVRALSGANSQQQMLAEATKLVLSRLFRPEQALGYVRGDALELEDRFYDYDISSGGTANLPAVIVSPFNFLCQEHPERFVNARSGAIGCPTKWDSDGLGIITHTQPGAPQPVMPLP